MILLTDEQVQFVRSDLRERGISMPGLDHDLLDHLLCGVENHLNAGYTFEKAYTFALRELTSDESMVSIQQETVLALKEGKRGYVFPMAYMAVLTGLFCGFRIFSHGVNPALILVTISLIIFFVYHIIFSGRRHKTVRSNLILFALVTMLPIAGVFLFLVIAFPQFNLLGTPGWCLLVIACAVPVYYRAVQKMLSGDSTVYQFLIHALNFISIASLLWIPLALLIKTFKPATPLFFLEDLFLLSIVCFVIQLLMGRVGGLILRRIP